MMTASNPFCDDELERSATVADCQMNQERGLVGSDSPGLVLRPIIRPSANSR